MIEVNKIYTYPELCALRNEKVKGGKSKQLQLQEWKRFFVWENITSQKFLITKIYDTPLEKIDNRKNNGAKLNFTEEAFEYLFNCIIYLGQSRNEYFRRGNCAKVYITNSLIYAEFGLDIYAEFNNIKWNPKDEEVQELFRSICLDAVKSNSITRICKKLGYEKNSLPKGILRQEGKSGQAAKRLVQADDLLPQYNDYMKQCLEVNQCKTELQAIEKGIYFDIVSSIQKQFAEENLYGVRRYSVIEVYLQEGFRYKLNKKRTHQNHFRDVVIQSIEKSVLRRIDGSKAYKYELNEWQKNLIRNYLEQLLGTTSEPLEAEEPEEELEWLNQI